MVERGIAAAQRGDCTGAIADLRAALQREPRMVPALNALAVCEAKLGHPEQAAEIFERIVALEPGAWQGWSNLGASWLSASRPDRALEPLRRAVQLAPGSTAAWLHLGMAYNALRRPVQAFDSFDRAQRLVPSDSNVVKAWLDAAASNASQAADLIEKKEYASARGLLVPLARPLAKSASWHNLLGYAEFKLGHAEPALEHLQQAIRLEPDNEDYLLDMGEFLGYYRAPKNAVEVFEIASRRMPQSVRVQFGLAVSYILLERRDDAVVLLEKLLASHPDYEPAYRALGECYEDAGDWDALISLGKKLQNLRPSNPLGWYLEGAGLLRNQTATESLNADAIAALRRAVELDPSSSRFHFTLGKAYEQVGQDQLAVRELKETLRLTPKHDRAHYVLARLYRKLGRQDAAKAELAEHSRIKVQDRNAEFRALVITSRQP